MFDNGGCYNVDDKGRKGPEYGVGIYEGLFDNGGWYNVDVERRKGWEPGQLSGIYEFFCTGCGNKFNYCSFYMQWNKRQPSKKYRDISFMVEVDVNICILV